MNNASRIVIVGPAYPLRGGIAQFNESLCASLSANGVPCSIVSFYLQYPAILFPGKSQKTEGTAPANIEIHEWLSSINPLSWAASAKRIAAMKPSHVIIRFWLPFMGPALGTLARFLSKKGIVVIGLVDNAIPHEARPMDRSLSAWFFRHCNAFVALSQNVASQLKAIAPGKPIHVHPHPVYDIFGESIPMNEAREKLNLHPTDPYVLFFGFVRKYKGLDLLLQAFAERQVRDTGARLLIAGEFYDDKLPYQQMMERLGIANRVEIRDSYIPDHEVKNYFCTANIIAQTYRNATQSGVTQIAYQFGRPMLVTNVGGLPEIVENGVTGFVAEPNHKAIAHAIERFFTEQREADFAKAVGARKHTFSWQHFTESLLTFAKQIKT